MKIYETPNFQFVNCLQIIENFQEIVLLTEDVLYEI